MQIQTEGVHVCSFFTDLGDKKRRVWTLESARWTEKKDERKRMRFAGAGACCEKVEQREEDGRCMQTMHMAAHMVD